MKRFCLFVSLVLAPLAAWGQLTATVTPGYSFAPGEFPTTATLNLLGTPTIQIQGTISGTVGLGARSVSGDHLMDSVVDNVTLDFKPTSPRELEVKSGGISAGQIGYGQVYGTNIASATITASNIGPAQVYGTNIAQATINYTNIQAGGVLGTNIGNATVTSTNIAAGAVYGTNIDNGSIGTGLQKVGNVISATTTIAASSTASIPGAGTLTALTVTHGLPSTPGYLRVVLVCQTADGSFSAGDELDGAGFYRFNSGSGPFSLGPMFSAWANATTANVAFNNTGGDGFLHWEGQPPLVPANWKIKLYYAR